LAECDDETIFGQSSDAIPRYQSRFIDINLGSVIVRGGLIISIGGAMRTSKVSREQRDGGVEFYFHKRE